MRQKKIEPQKEAAEENTETQEQPKDVKLAEFQLKESAVLLIKKTNYKGEDRIDFRVWLNSPKYKGPTKQGFVLTMDKVDAFVDAVNNIKKKLDELKCKIRKNLFLFF
jgi:alpha-L-arabinofuranosidase